MENLFRGHRAAFARMSTWFYLHAFVFFFPVLLSVTALLRCKSHIHICHSLQVYNSVVFSSFTELCRHCHNQLESTSPPAINPVLPLVGPYPLTPSLALRITGQSKFHKPFKSCCLFFLLNIIDHFFLPVSDWQHLLQGEDYRWGK